MNTKRTFLALGLAAAALATVWQIVGISSPHASGEAPACRGLATAFPTFQATKPPRSASRNGFLKDGKTQRVIADYRGKGVVLNFWATWCLPCVREMPALDRLQAEVEDNGIAVLALSSDREGAPLVDKFYRTNGIENLETLIDEGRKTLRAMGVRGLPTTILIDADGDEIGRVEGPAEWDSPAAVTALRACLSPATRKTTTADKG